MKAKEFNLPDQEGKYHKLSDYLGKWVVMYFYPKDDTPGCTAEACGLRDSVKEIQNKNADILGISKDSTGSHKKFAEKYHLNFRILSDEKLETIKAYNAWGEKKFMGKTFQGVLRKTYLIDPTGEIRKVYEKVNPLVHAEEIVTDLQNLS
jgi:thioredoxin-dependent peroxiredoxin